MCACIVRCLSPQCGRSRHRKALLVITIVVVIIIIINITQVSSSGVVVTYTASCWHARERHAYEAIRTDVLDKHAVTHYPESKKTKFGLTMEINW